LPGWLLPLDGSLLSLRPLSRLQAMIDDPAAFEGPAP